MEPDVARIAEAVVSRSAAGIAAAVNRLIKSGELAAGSRLPTVRTLAKALGTSPTTVNEAWRSLVRIGAVRTEGRNGSFVAQTSHAGWPTRFWRIASAAGEFAMDLSAGVPDPTLLPNRTVCSPGCTGDLSCPDTSTARAARAGAGHPADLEDICDPECLTVVDGSLDAVDRVLTSLVRLGDRVLVEKPHVPAVPGPAGAHRGAARSGAHRRRRPAAGCAARRARRYRRGCRGAAAATRAHNPTGISMSPARAAELADVMRAGAPSCVVVEDDHVGEIAVAEQVSLAPTSRSAR